MKKTFTKQSMGELRGRSFFLSLLFFLLFAGFTNTAQAQTGVTCASSISLTEGGSPVNDSLHADSIRWYSFVATSTSVIISEKLSAMSIGHIHLMRLFAVCGGSFIASDSITSTNDTLLTLIDNALTIGQTYYVGLSNNEPGCVRCAKGTATYQINIGPPPNPDAKFLCVGAYVNGVDLGEYCCRNKGKSGFPATGEISICEGSIIAFYPDPLAATNPVKWYTSGGSPSSAIKGLYQQDSVQYNTPGVYTVYYYDWDSTSHDTTTSGSCSIIIDVLAPPAASFTISPNPVCFNDTVTFTGHGLYDGSNWLNGKWIFGPEDSVLDCNGVSASYKCDSTATWVYSTPGTYPVSLVVSNGACTDTVTNYVTVNGPSARFKYLGHCLGSPTSFFASSSCTDDSVKWHWNFGDGGTSILQNPQHTYPSAGTYTVILTVTDDGFSSYVTQTVTINPLPAAPVLTGPADACGSNIVVCVSSAVAGDTYSWVSNGASSSVMGTGSCTSTPGNLSPSGGIVTFTVTDSLGCSAAASDTVARCCDSISALSFADTTASAILLYIHNYYSSDYSITHNIPSNTYIISPAISPVSPIYLNGTITVNKNLDFYDCQIRLGANAIINVNDSTRLTIERQSHLRAGCNQMWDGIYISHLNSSLVVDGSSIIEDAKNAIVSSNGGVYFLKNATLNNNYIGIIVNQYAPHYTGTIYESQISCLTNSGSGTPTTLLYPHLGQRSSIGIEINNVTNSNPILIGQIGAGNTNIFNNMDYGIYGYNSTFTVVNNEMRLFNNGVYATGLVKGTPAKTVIVGEQGNVDHRNYFLNGYTGVFINGGMNAYIRKNTFRNLRSTGVTIENCLGLTQKVDTNSIFSVPGAMGVYAYNNRVDNMLIEADTVITASVGLNFQQNLISKVTIQNNVISYKPIPFSYATAVLINETNYTYGTHYVAYNNKISNMEYGIKTNGLRGAVIYKNTINLEAYPTFNINYYSGGIYMDYSIGCHIESNDILATDRANYWVDGIRLESCSFDTLTCNYTKETGTGLFFSGSQPGTYMAKNNMYYNHEGIVLNYNGAIGAQYTTIGSGIHPNDNEWTPLLLGYSNTNPNTFSYFSDGALSNLYVRTPALLTNVYYPYYNTNFGGGSSPESNSTILGNLNSLFCPITVLPGPPFPTGFTIEARAIARDSVLFPVNLKQTQWWSKQHLYQYLKSNPAFAVSQPVLQTFKDSVAIANMGMLDSVSNVLANAPDSASLLTSAQSLNAAISPTDSIEGNMQSVNAMMLNTALSDTALNAEQLSALRIIANECPYIYGPAVYQARALLAPYDSLGTVYVNSCEIIPESTHHSELRSNPITPTTAFKLYPNPNNGNMTLAYSINQGDKGELDLFDFMGRKIATYNLNASGNSMEINETQLSNGMYFYRIIVNNINVKSDKLVIIK